MADFTLFPAETAVKLTPLAPAPIIADMPRAVFRAALAVVAALACNDGLQPTPAPTTCPKGGFVGICGTVTLRGTAPGNTAAVYIIAYNVFPQTRNDLFNFQPPFMSLNPLPHDRQSEFYTVKLPSGRYEWVLAAWVDTAFTLAGADTTLQVAGLFRDGAGRRRPHQHRGGGRRLRCGRPLPADGDPPGPRRAPLRPYGLSRHAGHGRRSGRRLGAPGRHAAIESIRARARDRHRGEAVPAARPVSHECGARQRQRSRAARREHGRRGGGQGPGSVVPQRSGQHSRVERLRRRLGIARAPAGGRRTRERGRPGRHRLGHAAAG